MHCKIKINVIWSGPDNPRIENADQSHAKLLNPSVGIYILQVKVTDEMGLESSDNVYITIKQSKMMARLMKIMK